MKNLKRVTNWHLNYGVKPYKALSPAYLKTLKVYTKWSRTKFINRSRLKTRRFERKHPTNLLFRQFKFQVLRNKRVKPELMAEFEKLVKQTGSIKNGMKYKHLTPKRLYEKMKK